LNFKRVFSTSPELLAALINAVRWDCPAITVESIQNPEIVPNDLGRKLIQAAECAQPEHWADKMLAAKTLEHVFSHH